MKVIIWDYKYLIKNLVIEIDYDMKVLVYEKIIDLQELEDLEFELEKEKSK